MAKKNPQKQGGKKNSKQGRNKARCEKYRAIKGNIQGSKKPKEKGKNKNTRPTLVESVNADNIKPLIKKPVGIEVEKGHQKLIGEVRGKEREGRFVSRNGMTWKI